MLLDNTSWGCCGIFTEHFKVDVVALYLAQLLCKLLPLRSQIPYKLQVLQTQLVVSIVVKWTRHSATLQTARVLH